MLDDLVALVDGTCRSPSVRSALSAGFAGVYTERTILRRGARVTLGAFPDVTRDVAGLLPG